MFSAIQEVNEVRNIEYVLDDDGYRVTIIADGGIRCHGDIAKAMVAGADMVMIGGLFAACTNSPAEDVFTKDQYSLQTTSTGHGSATNNFIEEGTIPKFKRYYGSASPLCKKIQKNIEGTVIELPCNGKTYEGLLNEMQEDLQSACSYAGVESVSVLRGKNIWKEL